MNFYDGRICYTNEFAKLIEINVEDGYDKKIEQETLRDVIVYSAFYGNIYTNTVTHKTMVVTLGKTLENIYEAFMNNQYFKELQQAIYTATEKDTIQLIIDLETSNKIEIPEGKNITLDLNGHTIISLAEEPLITNNGTLTIIYSEDIISRDKLQEIIKGNGKTIYKLKE